MYRASELFLKGPKVCGRGAAGSKNDLNDSSEDPGAIDLLEPSRLPYVPPQSV